MSAKRAERNIWKVRSVEGLRRFGVSVDEALSIMAEPRCSRCDVIILPKAPRVIGGGRNREAIWHPGCYEAQRRLHGGELDMSLEVTAR